MKSIFLCDGDALPRVFPESVITALEQEAGLDRTIIRHEQLDEMRESLADAQYIFSTWGISSLSEEELAEYFPKLEAVFYAAGSVQYFARPYLARGIRIFSAWCANAVPVAEYTVSQILLANKGFYQATRRYCSGDTMFTSRAYSGALPGNYGCKVGIIGVGSVGKLVCEMLRGRDIEILAYDPFLSREKADALGIRLTTLDEIFSTCQTVSNHVANNEKTVGIFTWDHFSKMPPGATFLNTGRGAQVVESDLIRALRERPDLTAVLDVTDPEPPEPDCPLFTMPNVFMTPHIAGSSGLEVQRMAEYMLGEFRRYTAGEPLQFEVTLPMLETMA